jgi:hypothetical protein
VKPASPLLGFNNNVRHKGRVFHIQTEDSGVRHPHIITHLFADGGRILKTTKTSYAEFIDAANMGEVVRQMMQDQHKAMFMALRDGQFDHLVDELPAARGSNSGRSSAALPAPSGPTSAAAPQPAAAPPPSPRSPADAPGVAAPGVAAPAPAPTPPSPLASPLASAPTILSTPAVRPAVAPPPLPPPQASAPAASPVMVPPPPIVVPPPPPAAALPATALPATALPAMALPGAALPASPAIAKAPPPAAAEAPPPSTGFVTKPTPSRVPAARPRLDIDPAAIHRAPSPSTSSSSLASAVEVTVQGGAGIDLETLERAAASAETPLFQQIHDLPPPPAAVLGARAAAGSAGGYSSITAPGPAAPSPPSARGRYAPSRPSSIFASVRPQEGASIFGEDLISEKSLDEVILSYLAEDLDGPGEKK